MLCANLVRILDDRIYQLRYNYQDVYMYIYIYKPEKGKVRLVMWSTGYWVSQAFRYQYGQQYKLKSKLTSQ